MQFSSCKDAAAYARMERVRTGIRHVVKPCRRYLCPPKEYFGRDWVPGFTVVMMPNN